MFSEASTTAHVPKLSICCLFGKQVLDCFVSERDCGIDQTFGPHCVEIRDDGEENG